MNYTKGCFDKIEHTVAVLVLMHFGVAQSIATTLFQVLQKVLHKIKTGYGVSVIVYGNKNVSITGIGYGNGVGPSI